jgi:hypothetical protein
MGAAAKVVKHKVKKEIKDKKEETPAEKAKEAVNRDDDKRK